MNQNKYDSKQSLAALLYHSSTPQNQQSHHPTVGGLPLAPMARKKITNKGMSQARPSHSNQLQLDQEQKDYLRSKYEITGPVAASSSLGTHVDTRLGAQNASDGIERFKSEHEYGMSSMKMAHGGAGGSKLVRNDRNSEQDKATYDDLGNKNAGMSNAARARTIIQK